MCYKIIYLCIIVLLAVTGFVKASCLEYGHSCLGGHGKRSIGRIYRSIDGSKAMKYKPSELLDMLIERSGRLNLDDTINAHDFIKRNNEADQLFDSSEQRLKRKLKEAFRKSVIVNYSPSSTQSDENNILERIESSKVRRHERPTIDSNNDYYQVEHYPSINQDLEYFDLK